ncbi:hypothetical protein BHF71_09015 [Vulcanibacillus modesticaldus]|uniref:Uncharacterized protein n=1 Tax=Vulcanibacillus modesticaldus TaxID=337097 RepID=A0A1D2YUU0_9BACI|nr:Ger(x)C family spore germination protein [Vulcanibacillus modesticaldus]OEF99441.1 hypothetical protein BHF71_09015 [Vulcanibacillus modesticaldus]
MTTIKKLLLVILTLTLTLSLVGCHSHEVNDLSIVVGIGVDYVEGDKPIEVTLQLINPDALTMKPKGETVTQITMRGKSLHDTMRRFSQRLPKEIYLGHNQVIIFGKKLAERGITPFLDYFDRETQIRRSNWVILSKTTAKDVLNAELPIEDISTTGIDDLLYNFQRLSYGPIIRLKELVIYMRYEGRSLVVPLFKVKDNYISYYGSGVFKKDKLIGIMDDKTSRGFLWLLQSLEGGNITTFCEGSDEKATEEESDEVKNHTSFLVLNTKRKIIPKLIDGKPKVLVKIEAKSSITEYNCKDDLQDPKTITKLEQKQAEDIKYRIEETIKLAQKEFQSDIFGFGEAFRRKYPRFWKKNKKNWDDLFTNLEVEIEVKSLVTHTGITSNPVIPK